MLHEHILAPYGFTGTEKTGLKPNHPLRSLDHAKMLNCGYVCVDGKYYVVEETEEEEECGLEDTTLNETATTTDDGEEE